MSPKELNGIGAKELQWAREKATEEGCSIGEIITLALRRAQFADDHGDTGVTSDEATALLAAIRRVV